MAFHETLVRIALIGCLSAIEQGETLLMTDPEKL